MSPFGSLSDNGYDTKCPLLEYYSARKGNEVSSHEKMCRPLNCTLLSKRSQSKRAAHHTAPTASPFGKGKTMGDGKKIGGLKGLGAGG